MGNDSDSTTALTGAEAAVASLAAHGVDVCFTNPGTSEMHVVAAFDQVPAVRPVLALFEGVATGAADGYFRMAGRPAATLLHLGPGLANGIANLHNARRARSGIVNIVGDHATDHLVLDAPLHSDLDGLARTVSGSVVTPRTPADAGAAIAGAVGTASGIGAQIATVVLRADVAWNTGGRVATAIADAAPSATVDRGVVDDLRALVTSGRKLGFLVGGRALTEPSLAALARIAASCNGKVLMETFPARVPRGAGRPNFERLGYFAEQATAQLINLDALVLVGVDEPVAFFAYPGRPSRLTPETCDLYPLIRPGVDPAPILDAVAADVADDVEPAWGGAERPARPRGALTPATFAAAIGATLPEGAIVSDEANTSGAGLAAATAGAPAHDWLSLTGGAIGQGLPVAVGAAVACPDRRVVALESDGSAQYTIQSLWTMAREQLDVTVVFLTNRSYAILNIELSRVGAAADTSRSLLSLDDPAIDVVSIARGYGIDAERATSAEHLVELLEASYATPGPRVIDVVFD